MARLTIQEARELGLLGPDELSAIGYNPFMPRAGASWTPTLGVRPGLSQSSFFRYPGISFRSGISPLRFGLGGLGQGLTLSPETPALGLGGIAAPVGRPGAARPVGRGVAGGIAGGIAGGTPGVGAEGSQNYQITMLPDGRRLIIFADGRQVIQSPSSGGRPGRMMPVMPEDYEAIQALGLAGRGVGIAQQLARVIGTSGPEAGRTEGPGGEPGGQPPVELAALTMDPAQMAALGELGINTDLLAPAGGGSVSSQLEAALRGGGGSVSDQLDALLNGPPVTGDVRQPFAPGGMQFGDDFLNRGGDLSLSPAFYAPGGATGADILDQSRNLYRLGLTPEDIQNYLMPGPVMGPGRGRDLDPRGMGVMPSQADIFQEQGPGAEGGVNFNVNPMNALSLLQSGIGVGQGALSGDPAALVGALLKSGMSVNQIAKLPGLNQAGISAGLGGALGLLNAVNAARRGDVAGTIGGGLSTVGAGANFLAASPGLASTTGLSTTALGATGAVAGGAGGLLSLAMGVKGLIDGGVPPVQSALQMAGGALSTYGALASLSAAYPALFGGTVLPSATSLLGSGVSAASPAIASALGIGGGVAAGSGGGIGAAVGASGAMGGATAAGTTAASTIAGTVAAPVAMIVIALMDSLSEMERARVRNAGFTNNPIKGALYSRATESIASANKILDSIHKTGDLSAVSTADLGQALTGVTNSMLPYYATAQGGRGEIRASDTITGAGGLPSAKAFMGGQTPAEYTQKAEMAKQGITGLVKELLGRGVTYEQIGQLPVSGDWARQSLDAGGDPASYLNEALRRNPEYAAEASRLMGRYNISPMDEYGNFRSTNQLQDALLQQVLGGSMSSSAENSKASGLMTAMYGGPIWAAIARMGTADPNLQELIKQHFDPWVNARTREMQIAWQPQLPGLTQQDFSGMEQIGPELYRNQAGELVGVDKSWRSLQDFSGMEPIPGRPGFYLNPNTGETIGQEAPPPLAPTPGPNYWEELAKQQAQAAPTGPTAFNPLAFLSALQGGNRVTIRAGEDTLQFVPYKPEQAGSYTAKDSGYSELGTGSGIYTRPSGQGGTEVYVPQSSTQDTLGRALSGSAGVTGALGSALAVPSGQEPGVVPGAGPAADIAPEPVAAGTASTAPTGGATAIPTGDQTPVPGSGGFKKGGRVPATGKYTLHEGEVVIPSDKANPGEGTDFLMDMAGQGDLKLGGEADRKLQMPQMGPGRLDRGFGPGPDGGSQPDDEARSVGGTRLAHHEESETVQDDSGKWVNVYGRNIKGKAGQPLPYEGNSYDTVDEAVEAAKRRSEEEGKKGAAKTPKWYVNMKEGTPSQDLNGTDPNVRRLAFTMEDVEDALEAGEAPIMVGKNILNAPPSLIFTTLKKAQDTQNKDPMKAPGIVAMAARMKRQQAEGMKPDLDELPASGTPAAPPRFPGDRGRGADVRLEDAAREDAQGAPSNREIMTNPGLRMPMRPARPPGTMDRMPQPQLPNPFMVRAPFARAMHMAQNPGQMPVGQQPMDRMLENIDRGVTAPSTLQESIREQRRQLTPQDLMNRPMAPAQPAQPSIFNAIRRLTG